MKKGIYIKSKPRFITFILICMFVITGVFNTVTGSIAAHASDSPQEYISVCVDTGDTLWDIAQDYMPDDMDTREAVYIIKKTNDIGSSISEGQTLLIPKYS